MEVIDLYLSTTVRLWDAAGPAAGAASPLREPLVEAMLSPAVVAQYGDRDTLVTTRSGRLVALVPRVVADTDADAPARRLHDVLTPVQRRRAWWIAAGRPHAGTSGVARPYQEAREALTLIERIYPDADLVATRDLLMYRALGRDRAALSDLVESDLTPLGRARGGARLLVDTLETYFGAGAEATETARRLHVSVRTVIYRLARVARVASVAGYDPLVAADRLTLKACGDRRTTAPWDAAEG